MKKIEIRVHMTPKARAQSKHGRLNMGVIKHMPILSYLRTRIVTPLEIIRGIKNPVYPNRSIGRILFNARYNAGKALNGVNYTDLTSGTDCGA